MQADNDCFEGKALNWFQWCETCNPNPTCDTFKVAVVGWFQPTMIKNPSEILIWLTQTGRVEDYMEQFEQCGILEGHWTKLLDRNFLWFYQNIINSLY